MGLHALLNSLNESALTMWSLRLPEEVSTKKESHENLI